MDKRMTGAEVVSRLENGMTIGFGGWGPRRKPMAIVREILRSPLRDLTVVAYGGPEIGMLCAAARFSTFERYLVTGVVHAPYGAHPTACAPEYGWDMDHLKRYAASALQDGGWQAYVDEFVEPAEAAYPATCRSSGCSTAPVRRTAQRSAVQAQGKIYTDAAGMVPYDMPRALRLEEIQGVIEEYRQAAKNALAANFDGVELHCTSGYLPMQFLAANTNLRDDAYGGSATKRLRFVVEALEAMADAAGGGRVGLRICPGNPFNDVRDDDPMQTYIGLLAAIKHLDLAYLHVIRSPLRELDAFELAREHFSGPLILNDGFDFESATRAVAAGQAEAVSFGRHFIANPDLVDQFRQGMPLVSFDRDTLYTAGEAGYTDYPMRVPQ